MDLNQTLHSLKKEGETIEDVFERLCVVRPAGVGTLKQDSVVDPKTYKFLCANILPKDQ